MGKIFLLITFFVAISGITLSQKTVIKGKITDNQTEETLIGANILLKEGVGTSTDIDGNFTIIVDNGEYNLQISYVGYKTIQKKITASGKTIIQNFSLESITLNEISVVADVARSRLTPVAYTNVLPIKIEEELASRDIPMILNSTPGVYATQQGGGDGDARITIRGFNQQNVAVMIDGIPVNDMENGWVYWSNWFGLDAVTRSIQVQRGLGSSKLAIPSVGGTMNIITKGIESKRGLIFKEDIDADGKFRTSLGLTSGKLKNGWGVTLAGSYKRGNGWVDETWSKGWFYYLKVDKKLKNHIITLSAMGAPQMHGQRKYKKPIAAFNKKYAESLGVDSFPKYNNMGTDYNAHWGLLDRYTYDDNGSIVHEKKEKLSEAVNYYHKPQFSLRDFWNVNDKLYISNIAYLSVGNGGGTAVNNTLKENNLDNSGQINWQPFYDDNIKNFDLAYSRTETKSTNWINSNVNNHFWYGLLTTLNYKILKDLTLSGGVDLRSYKGEHYVQLYDLLGGDYVIDNNDVNRNSDVYHEGDIINRHYDGLVRWGGAFALLEYKYLNFTTFLNFSYSESGYKKIDYFTYTPGNQETKWKWIQGYTIKYGLNYNLTEYSNIYANLGYLSKAREFSYIYERYSNDLRKNIKNELIKAGELGYTFNKHKIAVNVNGYYTLWNNKPTNTISAEINGSYATGDIEGLDALHKGIELDVAYKILPNVDLQGLISLGDWKWDTKIDNVKYYDNNSHQVTLTRNFNAKGVHVGDAAQTQYAASVRYEPIKNLYMNCKFTYFDRYYSDFDPISLDGSTESLDEKGNPRDSWKIPAYYLVDLNAGYGFKYKFAKFDIRFSVLNIFNKMYISDATNNDSYNTPAFYDFDAKSASVFFGQGRRYAISLSVTL